MSVEFFPCAHCKETIPDCGSYWQCRVCRVKVCDDCASSIVEINGDGEDICPFCAKEYASDQQLLGYALGKLGITREELLKMYQESK